MAARKTPSGGSKSDKPWRDALMLAVNERAKNGDKKLRRVADAVVAAALDGDMAAAKEIGDRLDGKATQPISAESDGKAVTATFVMHIGSPQD